MKKLFSKVSAFVLAFMMIFALGACGDTNMVDVKSSGEALTGAADAMLKQDGMTVTLDGSIDLLGSLDLSAFMDAAGGSSSAIPLKDIKLNGTFKAAKSETDTDFEAEFAVKMGEAEMKYNAVKKGTKMYSKSSLETKYTEENTEKIVIPAKLPEQASEILKQFDFSSLEKGKDSYTLKAELDYGAPLKKLQSFLKDNGEKTVNEYLFPGFTEEQNTELANKLNGLVEDLDTTTVPAFIAKIDAILDYVKGDKPAKTVKGLADSLFEQAGITASSLRDMIVKNLPDNSELAQMFPQPKAGQTAYDYILACIPQQMTVGTIANMIGGMIGGGSDKPAMPNVPETAAEEDDIPTDDSTTSGDGQNTEQGGGMASYYAMLVGILTSKGKDVPTISELYDTISSMAVGMIYQSEMGEYLDMVLSMIADWDVAENLSLEEGETYISWVNLKNMVFGTNKASVSVVLNGSDLTLKSINVTFKNDIKYKTSGTKTEQLTKADININLTFAYGAVTVEAPAASEIAGSSSVATETAA